jgi:GT2 family glycosyltransferase
MKIFLICPILNRKDVTQNFIEQIGKQSFKDIEVIFVDAGSTDGTLEMIHERSQNSHVLSGDSNWWWAKSINEGMRYLKRLALDPDDIIGFINDDVIFEDNYFDEVEKFFTQNNGILASALIDHNNNLEYGFRFDDKKMQFNSVKTEIECCSTRGLFVKFSLMEKLGPMRSTLLPHYLSDYDLTLRATRAGLSIMYINGVVLALNPLTHREGGSVSQNKKFLGNSNPSNILRRAIFISLHCKKTSVPKLLLKEISNLIRN